MRKKTAVIVRYLLLGISIVLAGFLTWQLLTATPLLAFQLNQQGPLVVVVIGLLILFTLGAGISSFTARQLASPIFFATILTTMALILWLRHPAQADVYRFYFLYGLLVALLSPFVLQK